MSPARAETLPPGGACALLRERYRGLLAEARERTLRIVEPVSAEDLDRVHHPLMSPLVWDLGHIAAFEDVWLCQRVGGLEPLRADVATLYDAAETSRAVRGDTPYLRLAEVHDFLEVVRRALSVLERADLADEAGPLMREGLVWELVLQHEHQHGETMLQTLSLAEPGVYAPRRRLATAPRPAVPGPEMVLAEGGDFEMGADLNGFAYDNERPRHRLRLPPFRIDRAPVTNRAYREFVEEGGYARPELWSADGREWLRRSRVERPLYWTPDGRERAFDRVEPIDGDLPVMRHAERRCAPETGGPRASGTPRRGLGRPAARRSTRRRGRGRPSTGGTPRASGFRPTVVSRAGFGSRARAVTTSPGTPSSVSRRTAPGGGGAPTTPCERLWTPLPRTVAPTLALHASGSGT